MSRQVMKLGLKLGNKRLKISMIKVIAYVQHLNPRLDPKNSYIAFIITIEINKDG